MRRVQIKEENCVGCTKCIAVCPVDAIVGAAGMMHTVLTDECIGCQLCIDPCPMDCIEWVSEVQVITPAEKQQRALQARKRVQRRLGRITKQRQQRLLPPVTPDTKQQIQEEIQAAVTRVKAKQQIK